MIQAMRDRLPDIDACVEDGQFGAHIGANVLARSLRLVEVDVDFAGVNPFSMFIQFRATGTPSDGLNFRSLA